MSEGATTAAVQSYLDSLAGDAPAEPIVRALLDRAVRRLHAIAGSLLHRSYPRLLRPPLNLRSDELLSSVVERLLKAMRAVRPGTVREFFALANQHVRWELNDLARRLDEQPIAVELPASIAGEVPPTEPDSSPRHRRILAAIDDLPEAEREVFGLVRIQGLTHGEAATIVGVSQKTIQRRLHRGLLLLQEHLDDLQREKSEVAP